MDTQQIKNYSWSQLTKDAIRLVDKIGDQQFDAIVGITRGVIYLAGILSQLLDNKNLYTINYHSYNGMVKGVVVAPTTIHQALQNKHILLCDDICDSGETLLQAIADLHERNNEVVTTTIHLRKTSVITPNYYAQLINDGSFIHYPWELNKI